MDIEQEIWRLSGEAVAMQSVLAGICMGLAESGDAGRFLVNTAFSYAETVADAGSLKLGNAHNDTHRAAMMSMIAHLQTLALGDGGGPKAAV